MFLAGGGKSGPLTANTTDATDVSGGALSKQTVTLTINIALGTAALLDKPGIGGLIHTNPGDSLHDKTVSYILTIANYALGQGKVLRFFGDCAPKKWPCRATGSEKSRKSEARICCRQHRLKAKTVFL